MLVFVSYDVALRAVLIVASARGGFPANVVDDMAYDRLFATSVIAHVEALEREFQDRLNASFDCDEARCVDC